MNDSEYELLDYNIRLARRNNPGVSLVSLIGIVSEFAFPTRNYYTSRYEEESNINEPRHKLSDYDLLKAFKIYNSRK